MKKTIQPKVPVIVSCLIACFLLSCKESHNDETAVISPADSANKQGCDTELVSKGRSGNEPNQPDSNVTAEVIHSLAELHRRLNKKASHFLIRTNRDTVLKCKEGTLLYIPADAFLDASSQGPVPGEIRISVKEYYKISDMMIQGLTTTSNNQLLETGGMINIKVTSKEHNDSCILKPGKNITIALANSDTNNVDRMQLFNGMHNNGNVNWEPQDGSGGFAQSWRSGRNNFPEALFPLDAGFVFPDGVFKVRPLIKNTKPENLKSEIEVSIRELVQHVGIITKKANGYIDTCGNLHCYKVGNRLQKINFTEIYSPTTVQNMKINLPVDVNLSYKSNLNFDYYQKLFKMGKGNPDSLVNVAVTLNPAIKITSCEKIKTVYTSALSFKDYQKKQKRRASLIKDYQKKLKQLRLDNEARLASAEKNATASLQNAQNYLLLSTSKLGWINCDRFYDSPAKADYLVKLNERASLLIVFNSIKSIMSSDKNGVFKSVPLDEKITIVGLKTENGQLFMALHETTVTEKPFEALSFVPVTVKEYKSRLEKLNGL